MQFDLQPKNEAGFLRFDAPNSDKEEAFPPNEDFQKVGLVFPGANCLEELPIANDTLDPKYPKPKAVFPVGADDPNALYASQDCPNAGIEKALLTVFPKEAMFFLCGISNRGKGTPIVLGAGITEYPPSYPLWPVFRYAKLFTLTGASLAPDAENTNVTAGFELKLVSNEGVALLFELANFTLPLAESIEKGVARNPDPNVALPLPTESLEKEVTAGKLEPNLYIGLLTLDAVSDDIDCKVVSPLIGFGAPNLKVAFFCSKGRAFTGFTDEIGSSEVCKGHLHRFVRSSASGIGAAPN
uniref:AlNc14C51G3975 protein n=1 Tax=Albugo laibachii Nc14 TaxID=890382 RepID=F0WBC8_9STRA|nr:AlNc14C51G3975 [Albugo laibachii Nc14]|eukprot:CCA18452.1 AlNc14C51G3975 [Albugo laibachii Nc14]